MQSQKTIHISDESWQTHRQQLYFFVLKRVQDSFAAEDITQDVLLRVYTHLDKLTSREKFLPWLYQIARNAIADYFRRSRPQSELVESLIEPDAEEEKSAYEQLAPCLLPLIQQLPAPYLGSIQYTEIENLTQRELAEKTGISLPGAKSRVQRGRKMLKEMLFQCCQLQLNAAGSLVAFQAQSECKACHSDTLSPHVEKCEV